MIRNYFKIAWRNLKKSKGYTVINVGGLATGMAVAMLIGLWIWDEVTYDRYNRNYDRIAQVMQHQTFNGQIDTWQTMPYYMGEVLRDQYGDNFKQVVKSSWDTYKVLAAGDKKLRKIGRFMEAGGPELIDVTMLSGTRDALKDAGTVLISASAAKAYFGEENAVGKTLLLDNKQSLIVRGVYKDLPHNSYFGNMDFIASWDVFIDKYMAWIKTVSDPWGSNAFLLFVRLADKADLAKVSARIVNTKLNNVRPEDRRYKPVIFLQPMSKWHLFQTFKNGMNTGGRIQFVWLFGAIGIVVLLLACINFMNLSTARSEKRAREVGIRKAVGSFRKQLIWQFFSESLLIVMIGFVLSVILVQLALPFFNNVADKQITIPWTGPLFWLAGIVFILLTSFIAGSYPAFYLSSFQPVRVLKGTFRAGRHAALPRKVLVVIQFAASLILIIGTIIVFRQVEFARNRPVGYSREGLLSMETSMTNIHDHFEVVRAELKNAGAIVDMAEASTPVTTVWQTNGNLRWKGKDPSMTVDMPTQTVSAEYGKTIGWKFVAGRDFSNAYATDSASFILNESAVRLMGLKDPVGETIYWDGTPFIVIGVIKDLVAESPYEPVRPSMYVMNKSFLGIMNIRINPAVSSHTALAKIEEVFKKYSPEQPFDYQFVDIEYAHKFGNEVRVGKLTTFFAILAIFISCLGLFGMASFMAEQRTKEIGVRKVLGASVFNLWAMLSKDFLVLVGVALLIAVPLAYYFMHEWLQHYTYRSEIAWWIFVVAGVGIIIVTLATVSFQSVKAALVNPVKSLRSE
ncbi:ABC-type antimicrobial peptide transport system, permease component [Chitinophaga sp. YR627]|uniref:ABC transporter permease n=1 Tax=Chitinophaga sp. YR627 TaxID=1881041 RepID=UPI0008F05541|nr:FtsX-like permease family protein [Chitinophaga sp. YR627]SFO70409.1 ABC-type antimicrobial peptide transport system, permease component [Chitinophaga sp. YR627]